MTNIDPKPPQKRKIFIKSKDDYKKNNYVGK